MEENSAVTSYILELEAPKREICEALRAMLHDKFPQLREEFKWSRPVYSSENGGICYIAALKNHINLGFDDGAQIEDPRGLLQGNGKSMRHVKLRVAEDIDEDYLSDLVRKAIAVRAG